MIASYTEKCSESSLIAMSQKTICTPFCSIVSRYDVLYKLIRELSISPDLIFYPEKPSKESEVENLIRMLYTCDERSLEVVKATAKALIGTASEK